MKGKISIILVLSFIFLMSAWTVVKLFKYSTKTPYEKYQKNYNALITTQTDKTEYLLKQGKRTFVIGKPEVPFGIVVVDYFGPDKGYGTIDMIYFEEHFDEKPIKKTFYPVSDWRYSPTHIAYMKKIAKENFQINYCNDCVPKFKWVYLIGAPSNLNDRFSTCVKKSIREAEEYYQLMVKKGDSDKNIHFTKDFIPSF